MSIRPEQSRMARALLNWTVRDLAAHASIGVNTVCRCEQDGDVRRSTLDRVRKAFEEQGIDFIEEKDGRVGILYRPQ